MTGPSAEYDTISNLQSILTEHSDAYEMEIGDDAAVRKASDSHKLVFTTDLSVEDVHFSCDWMTFEEIGYKAMVSNVSDCAAMGAEPESALIQLVFPSTYPHLKQSLDSIYRGFNEACKRWGFSVIGGDLSSGDKWVIGISMVGKIPKNERALYRNGVQNGDKLYCTGLPGRSAAGLAALKRWGRTNCPGKYQHLLDVHIRPEPRVDMAVLLRKNGLVHAMMDLSDGVSKDCRTLAFESRLGAIIELDTSLYPESMVQLSSELNVPVLDWGIHGGEEYELLFAAAPAFTPVSISEKFANECVCIGEFTDKVNGLYMRTGAELCAIPAGAWDHFRV